jgi:hypothetical protein
MKLKDEHGFAILYSLLWNQHPEDTTSLPNACFKTLFLFGYKQAEELSTIRARRRQHTILGVLQDLVPSALEIDAYTTRFMQRLSHLQCVGGNMNLVLTVGADWYHNADKFKMWLRNKMAHEFKTFRDGFSHSRVRRPNRPGVLADAFVLIDLVMIQNGNKLILTYILLILF